MKKEKGLTLTGMILGSIVGVILMLLAFKIVPVYTEYFAIERNLKAMAMDPKLRNAGPKGVAGAWALRASVDDLHSLDGDYIEMTKEVAKAASALGIALHDHVVIGQGEPVSFKSMGLL